jgi:hypothetical protein
MGTLMLSGARRRAVDHTRSAIADSRPQVLAGLVSVSFVPSGPRYANAARAAAVCAVAARQGRAAPAGLGWRAQHRPEFLRCAAGEIEIAGNSHVTPTSAVPTPSPAVQG